MAITLNTIQKIEKNICLLKEKSYLCNPIISQITKFCKQPATLLAEDYGCEQKQVSNY